MSKLHTNFRFYKLHEIDESDYGIYYFGIFIRTIERHYRKHRNKIERIRNRNETYSCCVCKSTDTARHPTGTKIWFRYSGQPICVRCQFSMRRHSEETRRKLSQQKMGPRNPNFGKFGLANPLFGRRISKLECEKNPKWRGGITDLNSKIRTCSQYSLWREKVFARDNYRCMRCGDGRGGNLEAHHIKSFYKILAENCISDYEAAMACNELWEIDNGITVCEKCHTEVGRGAAW